MAFIRAILSALALFAATALAVAQGSDAPQRRAVVVENIDFYGGDLEPRFNTTFEACERACIADENCTAFTYNTNSFACFPKAKFEEMRAFEGAVSARIVELSPVNRSRIEARAADLTFLPAGYIAEAHELARQIGIEFPSADRAFIDLITQARRASAREAAQLYGAALNVKDAADIWGDLSRAFLQVKGENYRERRDLLERGTAAAINGYLRAERPSTQASALNQVAFALEKRGEGRKMIDALRLSLKLARRDGTQNALDAAIEKYGFRILDHTVDSNAASPRICVTFSEDLKTATDYSPFVRLNRRTLPVEAEGSQLCIDGVEHGNGYKFTVREGLPAASGESLNRSVDLDVYVRDRNPAVRFTGRAYVLPKSAKASIPIVTVNLDEVALRIHRVGVRNLRTVAQRNMLDKALDGYDEREIASELGVPVWEGVGEIKSKLNKDVTTALPIGDAITKFEPGVYVMTARRAGSQDWIDAATQWFIVTDLGLTTLSGSDGLHVFARSLASAAVASGAEVQLIAANNEVLASASTNDEGYLAFSPGLMRSDGGLAPAMITIEGADGDFAFLDLTQSGFDLADRGVEGRAAPGPVDVFVSTERGAYRPGETVNATFLVRDARAMALADFPITAIISRPDGVEHSRAVLKDEGAGGRSYSFDLSDSAARGAWEIAVYADPKAPVLAQQSFLVEDFTPERIDFDLQIAADTVRISDVPDLSISGRYLYGAPAANMPISGLVRISATDELEGFPGFSFGLESERVDARAETLPKDLTTDAQGEAVVPLPLPAMEGVSKPLKLSAVIRLRDGSGRPVERVLDRALAPTSSMIGIKPLFKDTVEQGGLARFEVIGVDRNGARTAFEAVGWEVSKINTRYQWYEVNGSWRYEPTTRRERIASGDISIGAGENAVIEVPVTWGRYELKLISTSGAYTASSVLFDAGWYAPVAGSDTPDTLEVSLDKERYAVGETAKLRVNARFAGKVLVAALDNRIVDMKAVDVAAGETVIDMPVTEDWGPGAYLTATLIRPMDVDAGRNPSRAIGLQWAAVDPMDRELDVAFITPDAVEPRGPMQASVKIANLPKDKRAYATIAAVDVGVLNITGFDAPDPAAYYFGQRRLGVDIRDVYGRLIDGALGTPGRIRSGGDGPGSGKTAPPPNEDVLAFFSGVVDVDESGIAKATFDLPDFNGTVKLMAIVWSEDGVGNVEKDVQVVDPVVVSVSVPRFLAPGDESRVLVEFAHASGPKGEITLDVEGDEGLHLDKTAHVVNLQSKADLLIPVTAKTVGEQALRFVTTTPDGKVLTKTVRLAVRANDPEVLRQNRIPLAANGGTLTVDGDTFAGLRAGTGRATLAVGPLARFDVPGLLRDLDAYPYGCTEQTTSRAFPLLYFNDVASAMGVAQGKDIETRIEGAVRNILARQANGGSFGLWRVASGDAWLDAYVTDLLSQARQKGYNVPEAAMQAALSNLRNRLAYAADFDSGGEDIAYALLVLAREGMASIGDLRYYADAKAEAFATPLAKAQVGAALAAYGEPQRADRMFRLAAEQIATADARKPYWRSDYGSRLRDAAGVLALSIEANSEAVDRAALVKVVNPLGLSQRPTSTQEKVWSLFAAKALVEDAAEGDITVDGLPTDGPVVRLFDDQAMGDRTVIVANRGETPTEAVLTTFGIPTEPPVAGGNGFTISRAYYTLDGDEVTPNAVAQNDRLIAVITVRGEGAPKGRLMVDDPLPAGFEIDNPTLLRAGEIASLDWLSVRATEMAEFRSDRFLAAVDAAQNETFQLAYIVRAVSPGRFYHPAASVEDMYRPEFRANSAAGRVEVLGPVK
jgi:uncharacterized protein YfaS (alpha-2-macroglobulin family)